MGNLFRVDGEVYKFMEKVADCMIVSVLWTLFSLPIFTIGASTTALYYTTYKVIRHGTGHLWQEFWLAFKSNFKQATLLWLLLLLVTAFLGFDCYFAYILSDVIPTLQWILVLLVVILAFLVMWSVYWFPYIAHITDSAKAVLKNTLTMCILHFPKSLVLLAAFGASLFLMVYLPLAPALLIILPGGLMYFLSWILGKVFCQYWDMELPDTEV